MKKVVTSTTVNVHLLEHMAWSICKLVVSFDGKPLLVINPQDEKADLPEVLQVLPCQSMDSGPQVKEPVGHSEPACKVKGSNHHYLEAVWD